MMAKKLRCMVDPEIVELTENLKLLSDPNRLRIICYLLQGERCVCEVERELAISQQLASHHLNALKDRELLRVRRERTSSYYSVVEEKLDSIIDTLLRYLGSPRKNGREADIECCRHAHLNHEREESMTTKRA